MQPAQALGKDEAQDIPGLARALIWQALPSAGSQVLSMAISTITVVWISRLDDPVLLAAVGLGTMLPNVFGFSIGYGLAAGLNSRLSHSFGSQRPDLMRLDLQRAQLLTIGLSVPCMVGLLFSKDFFLLVGINAPEAEQADRYIRGALICLPFYMHFVGTSTMLQTSRLPEPDCYVRIFATLLHPLWLYLFMHETDLGFFGAGLAYSASTGLIFLLLTVYVLVAWPGPAKDGAWVAWPSFTELLSAPDDGFLGYLKVVTPSAFLIWCEWWTSEIMFILAGLLGTEALAAHTAASQIALILFMIPLGQRVATNTLVGNAMGEGKVARAKTILGISCALAGSVFVIIGLLLYAFSDSVARFFSSNAEVLKTFKAALLILPIFALLEAVQTVLEGGLTGLRLEAEASTVKVISMLFVRLGGGWLLAFPLKLGLAGIWLSGVAGMAVTLVLYALILWRADLAERQPLLNMK